MRPRAVLMLVAVAAIAASSPTPSPTPNFQSAAVNMPSTAIVGSSVAVSGGGFPSNSTIAVYVDTPSSYAATPARLNEGGPQTDGAGAFNLQIVVPDEPYGRHQMCADTGYPGSSERYAVKACAAFDVQANLIIDPGQGPPGARFTLTGTGWPALEWVALYPDRTGQYGPFFGTPGPQADDRGDFATKLGWPTAGMGFPVDPTTPGPHVFCGDTGIGAGPQAVAVKLCVPFVVNSHPAVFVNPSTGALNTQVTVSGTGFLPSQPYTITVDATPVICSTVPGDYRTDASGVFAVKLSLDAKIFERSACGGNKDVSLAPGVIHICGHTFTVNSCADFELLGPPQPAASKTTKQLDWTRWPLAIAAFLVLVALAALAIVGAMRTRRRS